MGLQKSQIPGEGKFSWRTLVYTVNIIHIPSLWMTTLIEQAFLKKLAFQVLNRWPKRMPNQTGFGFKTPEARLWIKRRRNEQIIRTTILSSRAWIPGTTKWKPNWRRNAIRSESAFSYRRLSYSFSFSIFLFILDISVFFFSPPTNHNICRKRWTEKRVKVGERQMSWRLGWILIRKSIKVKPRCTDSEGGEGGRGRGGGYGTEGAGSDYDDSLLILLPLVKWIIFWIFKKTWSHFKKKCLYLF